MRNNGIELTFKCSSPYDKGEKYNCPFWVEDDSSGCKFAHNDSEGTHCENGACIRDSILSYVLTGEAN